MEESKKVSGIVSFRISPEEDAEYMKAVEDGAPEKGNAGQKSKSAYEEWKKEGDVKNAKQEVLNAFHSIVNGNTPSRRIKIGTLTEEGRNILMTTLGIPIKKNARFSLNTFDLRHIYKDHYGTNEKDTGNNIPLTDTDIEEIVDVIMRPEHVAYGVRKDNGVKIFFFFKENNNGVYNLAEVYSDKYGNFTTKTYYNTKRGISQRVNDLRKSQTLTSVTDGAIPLSGAKIPQIFEPP